MFERNGVPKREAVDDSNAQASASDSSMFQYDSLKNRAYQDFSDFKKWADTNPDRIAEHFERYEQHIIQLQKGSRFMRRLTHSFTKRANSREKEQEYADYFGITNLGRLPSDEIVAAGRAWQKVVGSSAELTLPRFQSAEDAVRFYASYIPGTIPDELIEWSGNRLENLYRILPEFVIQEGGMEKVIRTMMGVVALAGAEASEQERNERIAQSMMPAYFYAATYPIVDDILHDSNYVQSDKDKTRYHDAIAKGLSTGQDINESELPDHPLAEEMLTVYNEMRDILPFDEYRDTYYALESMYRAQHDDANVMPNELSNEADLYVPIILKASLSRIVAHMVTGHDIGAERSSRMLRTLLRQQLADDQRDVVEDLHGERMTPFTLHITHPEFEFGNPLFYRMAQEAYIQQLYLPEESERVSRTLSKFGAYDMAYSLSTDAAHAEYIRRYFGDQGGPVDHLIRTASSLGRRVLVSTYFSTPDKHLAKMLSNNIPERDPQLMDPRTYVSDALSYVNETLTRELSDDSALEEVMRYALEAGGKRVRPAMTLMLAESLGIERQSIEPLLVSTEFAHTASLIFDDLPAQDNATLRRDKEAVHIKFPEYDAQLAGISMISHSVGVLGKLGTNFPADRVNRVVEYVGTMLGARKLALGQHMDLAGGKHSTSEEIVEMYNLKTSTLIEGALVPLMILDGRSEEEVEIMQQYAYHAGIVFQLRDDILDATSSAEVVGKDSGQDVGKRNIVTTLGIESAQAMLDKHLKDALGSLSRLSFPTNLLQELTEYFATRKK